jgi:hypothetical protein
MLVKDGLLSRRPCRILLIRKVLVHQKKKFRNDFNQNPIGTRLEWAARTRWAPLRRSAKGKRGGTQSHRGLTGLWAKPKKWDLLAAAVSLGLTAPHFFLDTCSRVAYLTYGRTIRASVWLPRLNTAPYSGQSRAVFVAPTLNPVLATEAPTQCSPQRVPNSVRHCISPPRSANHFLASCARCSTWHLFLDAPTCGCGADRCVSTCAGCAGSAVTVAVVAVALALTGWGYSHFFKQHQPANGDIVVCVRPRDNVLGWRLLCPKVVAPAVP